MTRAQERDEPELRARTRPHVLVRYWLQAAAVMLLRGLHGPALMTDDLDESGSSAPSARDVRDVWLRRYQRGVARSALARRVRTSAVVLLIALLEFRTTFQVGGRLAADFLRTLDAAVHAVARNAGLRAVLTTGGGAAVATLAKAAADRRTGGRDARRRYVKRQERALLILVRADFFDRLLTTAKEVAAVVDAGIRGEQVWRLQYDEDAVRELRAEIARVQRKAASHTGRARRFARTLAAVDTYLELTENLGADLNARLVYEDRVWLELHRVLALPFLREAAQLKTQAMRALKGQPFLAHVSRKQRHAREYAYLYARQWDDAAIGWRLPDPYPDVPPGEYLG